MLSKKKAGEKKVVPARRGRPKGAKKITLREMRATGRGWGGSSK